MKVAILLNEDTSFKCTGSGCLKAFFSKTDAFDDYPENAELVAFFHIGGKLENKLQRLKEKNVETIHLSSCLRSKYDGYEELAKRLSEDFNIIGYTHGKEQGKTREAIIYKRQAK